MGVQNVVRIETKGQLRRFIGQVEAGRVPGRVHLIIDATAYADEDNASLAEVCSKNAQSTAIFFGRKPRISVLPSPRVKALADLSFSSTRNKWERILRRTLSGVHHRMGALNGDDEPEHDRAKRRLHVQSGEAVLTPRQSQVLALILEGLTNKQIALRMGLAESTIKGYVGDLMSRFRVFRRTQLMALHAEGAKNTSARY